MATNAATALTGTSSTIVGLPTAGTSAVYKLDPGSYTQFMFKMDQVDAVELRADGSLEMKLDNGSTLVIQNFKELANSAETCGRDTVFQMLEDKTSAGGEKFTSIMNISPDGLMKTLDPAYAADSTITLNEPATGVTKEVMMEPGQTYKINFDWDSAGKTVDGTNLMLSFKNGGLLILRDFVPAMQDNMPPAMTLADGTAVDPSTLIVAACAPVQTKGEDHAAAPAPQSELRAPDVEPAAGDAAKHVPAKKVASSDMDNTANSLANIEPAAGGGGSPASGGRGGAGFASGIDDANLNGLNPIGPIGPTALLYGIPRVEDFPVSGSSDGGPGTPANPPVPGLVVRNEQLFEDTNVALNVSTSALSGTTTTLVISGIPSDWIVDPGLGTYDAGTGTWTIVIPAGGSFSGGPQLTPPADADGDIIVLDVKATATDLTTGLTSVSTGTITVTTDAVADMPNLAADNPVVTEEDTAAPLTITSSLNDTDGSEVLSIKIEGLPTGATLSAGVQQPDGSYILTPAQLVGLQVIPPTGYVGTFTLLVTSTSTETNFSGGEFNFENNVASTQTEIQVTIVRDDVPVILDGFAVIDETNLTPVVVNGTVNPDFGSDTGTVAPQGAASFVAAGSLLGGNLTSNGVPVVVTLDGNTYTGKAGDVTVFTLLVNTNGTYTFTQLESLDHADASDPNDVIDLTFGVVATDNEGDSTPGTITIGIRDDAPVANDDSRSLLSGETVLTGNVTDNDDPRQDDPASVVSVQFGGVTYPVPTSGSVEIVGLYGTLLMAATGAYTYTSNDGANGTDVFTYLLRDYDGDTDPADLTIATRDGKPEIGDSKAEIDETDLGPVTVNGTYSYNYGPDGPGTITAQGDGSFNSTGSKLGGALTSNGVPVVVELLDDNTYIGTAGGVTIFTLHINTNGTYAFTLNGPLDHADGTDANDVINLNFGVAIADEDGDTDTGVISVAVKDDAPIANDECNDVPAEGSTVTGNALDNDVLSADDTNHITSVSFGGVDYAVPETGTTTIVGNYGTLEIAADGSYTYILNGSSGGGVSGSSGTFNEVLEFPVVGERSPTFDETSPNEGMAATALDITGDAAGTVKILSETAFYKNTLGSFTIGADGTLQMAQVIVTDVNDLALGGVTNFDIPSSISGIGFFLVADGARNNDYSGMDLSSGNLQFIYHYGQPDQRPATINDVGYRVSLVYTGGDTDVVLAGPIYYTTDRDGSNLLNPDGHVHTLSGLADDTDNTVLRIGFEDLPNQGDKDFSDVVFDFSYTPKEQEPCDEFVYTLTDGDGDSDTATLCFDCVIKPDGQPTIGDVRIELDETNLSPVVVNGTYAYNYGTDGAGAIVAEGAGSFSATGSLLGGALTHDGVPVNVTLAGNTYTGKAGDVTVFTLTLNADGAYTFTLLQNLDHADGTNANDTITLNFGVKITDADNDADYGVIAIDVRDDAPVAVNDDTSTTGGVATGNVLTNDDAGEDNPGTVTAVTFNGTTYAVPAVGNATVIGLYGTLLIAATGAYTYTANDDANGTDGFGYTMVDRDGDPSSATLSVDTADGQPSIGDSKVCTDETDLGPVVVDGTYGYSYGTDGAGSISLGNAATFSATGSLLGGNLTSNGVAVAVALVGNTYTGTAGGVEVFTMTINDNGTYTFTLKYNLDHADGTNPDDAINLNFTTTITDSDGDSDNGVITVCVKDDAPVANDDDACDENNGRVVTGNVLGNDDVGADNPGTVSSVTFNGTTYAVDGARTIIGQYGTLVIENDGDYTYTAKNSATTTTKTTCLDANDCDVAALCDPSITKNGITVDAVNPNTCALLKDLTWVTGCGDSEGIGVYGNGSSKVNGETEGLRLSFDCPAEKVELTLGCLDCRELKTGIMVDIYTKDGAHTTTELNNGVAGCDGSYTFTLNGCDITKLVVYADGEQYSCYNSNTTWTLVDVKATNIETVTTHGTDDFVYTLTDTDGDTDTATLSVCADGSNDVPCTPCDYNDDDICNIITSCQTGSYGCDDDKSYGGYGCTNVVECGDDVTKAIDDFVCKTGSNDNCVTTTKDCEPVRCVVVEQPTCQPDDQQQQAA